MTDNSTHTHDHEFASKHANSQGLGQDLARNSNSRGTATSTSPKAKRRSKFSALVLSVLIGLLPLGGLTVAAITSCMSLAISSAVEAAQEANILETSFFSVDLGDKWRTAGPVHNSRNALNINIVNVKEQSSINIVVGSGLIQPYALLTSMQKTLRNQHAMVGPVAQKGALLFFEYNLNGLGGVAMSATNGRDVSSITILGNPQAAIDLIKTFKDKDAELFPDL